MRCFVKIFYCFILVLVLFGFFLPNPNLKKGISYSKIFTDRNDQILRISLAKDETYRMYIPLEEVPPALIESTLLYEDRFFYQHIGTNPVSLLRAFLSWCHVTPKKMGASTITMQVARLRYQLHTKTILGKVEQIYRALQLERHCSKQEILEAYFNLAPYGKNISGIEAASRYFFKKSTKNLSKIEILTLAIVPQHPAKRSLASQKPSFEARQRLFNEWIKDHPEDQSLQTLLTTFIPEKNQFRFSFRAPHFVESLSIFSQDSHTIKTTLDLALQTRLEKSIQNYILKRQSEGIRNASAILVHAPSREILAAVGSANYNDDSILGKISGLKMLRSPGSALKPFVYGFALDRGLIHPASLLKDLPQSFAEYDPENFDHHFLGPIQAWQALVQSRNLPAVSLYAQMPDRPLYNLLKVINVNHLKPEEKYGLTLVLGSAEISPENLASLYAMLINRGIWAPLKKTFEQESFSSKKIFSPEASFLVLDMLTHGNYPKSGALKNIPIAWKTGTSFSFRDAWTAGVFGDYVLVVWIGNFDGASNNAFLGRTAATPLFFEIIQSLEPLLKNESMLQPKWHNPKELHLTKVDLCALCGDLVSPACPVRTQGWIIPGTSPLQTCSVHQVINKGTPKEKIVEVWPSDILRLFKLAGIPRKSFGETDSSFQKIKISSPKSGIRYVKKEKEPLHLNLIAEGNLTTKQLFWFCDKTFLGTSEIGKPLDWSPSPGEFQIIVFDEIGNSDSLTIQIDSF